MDVDVCVNVGWQNIKFILFPPLIHSWAISLIVISSFSVHKDEHFTSEATSTSKTSLAYSNSILVVARLIWPALLLNLRFHSSVSQRNQLLGCRVHSNFNPLFVVTEYNDVLWYVVVHAGPTWNLWMNQGIGMERLHAQVVQQRTLLPKHACIRYIIQSVLEQKGVLRLHILASFVYENSHSFCF